jgi:hypothetical protein
MFSVKWVTHRHETQPVEFENSRLMDLNEVVRSCRARLSDMRREYPGTPPDGFCFSAHPTARRCRGATSEAMHSWPHLYL